MKKTTSHLRQIFTVLMLVMAGVSFGQSKADVFNGDIEITWLGLDFTQTKFIGDGFQFKDAGEITNSDFKEKYAAGWNQLFLDEMKKFNVAEAVHRTEVKYATEVTDKANSQIKGEIFTKDPDQYKKLDENKIKALVKQYDFKDNKGIGLIFFIDGMSKAKTEAGAWITFVDMDKKTVLYTTYQTGKPSGFGFRNYWAGAYNDMLKEMKKNYKKWSA